MFRLAKIFFLHAQTPLHAGSGQDVGLVDLPIQRERHTGWPKIEGSGMKGSIREVFEELYIKDKEDENDPGKLAIELAFGPESDGDKHAGALGFTDARLLLFPVKSMKGVFAYITCPSVLERFARDRGLCFQGEKKSQECPFLGKIEKNTASSDLCLIDNQHLVLEEYTFKVKQNDDTFKLAEWLSKASGVTQVQDRLVILSDDDFRDFVQLSTEVITRTKISSETGTVVKGALFTEEYLPTESLLYSLALASPLFHEKDKKKQALKSMKVAVCNGLFKNKKEGIIKENDPEEKLVMSFFEFGLPDVIQIGGNATLGKGIVRTKIMSDPQKGEK